MLPLAQRGAWLPVGAGWFSTVGLATMPESFCQIPPKQVVLRVLLLVLWLEFLVLPYGESPVRHQRSRAMCRQMGISWASHAKPPS